MDSSPNRKAVPGLLAAALLILIVAGCNGAYPGPSQGSNLTGISVQPVSMPAIVVAGTLQLSATGGYQESTSVSYKDVTNSAIWSTSNDAVAIVNKGLVTGTGSGSATITATLDGKKGSTKVLVGLTASIAISPTGTGVFSKSASPVQPFHAMATYSDGSVLDFTNYATWSSSPAGILTFPGPTDYVSDRGDATLVATGTTTITAALSTGESGTMDVTVIP
jgi:hypothetical protein